MQTTQQSLGIFWDGEEIDGITVYGFWKQKPLQCPYISAELGEEGLYERHSELLGKDWYVHIWDIKIEKWPSDYEWRQSIHNMLRKIIDAGACVAWGGLEGAFVDPPDLFKPEYMYGGVWVAMTNDGNFYFYAELAHEFKKLKNDELDYLSAMVLNCTK